ncbi:hypothetical protein [Halobellus clavatus]|uniref:DUF4145 domain-containing protein n=1 Tax=Halobellus clavatus TaxID=660517 RepID=A0A1H3KGD1_9EURY|nr:hypothetical protein [Halobellus clavatus]SDY51231.1 hypothetical protein SAMN04487946_11944 [Halobellus clavatus]
MSAPVGAIEEKLDQLEDDADRIEDLYTEFFDRIRTYEYSHVSGYYWDTPSGEIEELQRRALKEYEVWFNTASPLISEYLSNRSDDFEDHYDKFKKRLKLDKKASETTKKSLNAQNADFDSQRSMLESIPARVKVEELKVREQVSKNVAQTELDRARQLFDEGELRVSGVLAGVALERYLLMLCENADDEIGYSYRDGISALAQKLYEADEIDSTSQKHLQHLADIRANCAHANEENPAEEDVRRLTEDVEDYIRGRKL